MKITSVYDDSIVYDTEKETINGSRIKSFWLSDGYKKYEYTIANEKMLTRRIHGNVWETPYDIYETEDGNFYTINGGRWDGLMKWTW